MVQKMNPKTEQFRCPVQEIIDTANEILKNYNRKLKIIKAVKDEHDSTFIDVFLKEENEGVKFKIVLFDLLRSENEFLNDVVYTIFSYLRAKFGLEWYDTLWGFGITIKNKNNVYIVYMGNFHLWRGEVRKDHDYGETIYFKEGNFKEILNDLVTFVIALV